MIKHLITLLLVITVSSSSAQWVSCGNGLAEKSSPMALAAKGSTLFAVFSDGMFFSTDKAKSWQRKVMSSETGAQPDFQKIYVCGDSIFAGGSDFLYLSGDRGNTWKKFEQAPKSMYFSKVISRAPDLYVGTVDGLFYSSNKGVKWKEISSKIKCEIIVNSEGEKLKLKGIDNILLIDKTIYAGASTGVYISSDNGKTWKALNEGFPKKREVTLLEIIDGMLYASLEDGLYVSQDRGLSWKKVERGLPENIKVSDLVSSGSCLFASVWQKGLFISKDKGLSWTEFNAGFPKDVNTWALLLYYNRLYAGVIDQGIWSCDVSELMK